MDEYLDLVNEQDEVIGKKLRSEGELWIPRRTADKTQEISRTITLYTGLLLTLLVLDTMSIWTQKK